MTGSADALATPALVTREQKLIKEIDKAMKNRCSSLRKLGDTRFEEGLHDWLASRPNS
ncbi:hypothetical protein F2Q68_00027421 [Brassica cretica]|uniref:Uncharacterized protein n=1 Tax=Brassica cretica TaxID=69181 RepID=A0A8S9IDD3_BRACR|nr:hypothetical protein F2Q68_00027421 [Brassica cretica]